MKHTDRNHYGNKFKKVYKNAIDVALLDLEAAIKYQRWVVTSYKFTPLHLLE